MVKTFPCLVFYFFFWFFLAGCVPTQAGDLAERVVIVVNERDPDSVRIGAYYAERRGIPRENIIALDMPVSETISREEYVDFIHNPLQRVLLERDWLIGLHSRLKDPEGRYRSLIEGHRMSYLVVCRGVPLRIKHDSARVTQEMTRAFQKELLTNSASVDSELALLTALPPIIAFIKNPLFGNNDPSAADLMRVIKVARLDGPTVSDAMALVDHALEGERLGLRGRAYVDLQGPFPDGAVWLEATANQIGALGYDLQLHEPMGVFPASSRFDAPALYFGWYTENVSGPFLLEDFRFPPGAIAFHIHSFSARTLGSDSLGWAGPFVARGATVTMGNVYEPYLDFTHQPHLFFQWIKDGGNVGDAAAYSVRVFGWQGVLIGDPLYRPFARSLEDQLAAIGENEANLLDAYAIIRRINLWAGEGRQKKAIEEGRAALKREPNPNIALALAVARLQLEARDRRRAIQTLGLVQIRQPVPLMEVMLAKEAADLLSTLNEHDQALRIYEVLLEEGMLPVELRTALLHDGILLARRLARRAQARDWRGELDQLVAEKSLEVR